MTFTITCRIVSMFCDFISIPLVEEVVSEPHSVNNGSVQVLLQAGLAFALLLPCTSLEEPFDL